MFNPSFADCGMHQLGDTSHPKVPIDTSNLSINHISCRAHLGGYHLNFLAIRDSHQNLPRKSRELRYYLFIHKKFSQPTRSRELSPEVMNQTRVEEWGDNLPWRGDRDLG